mmetsp:Transcript_38811/g.89773  ORF Transcript_38811/g.89773 Transcript_38811/m.89773 type:complete len:240 (+) Transcript_38811:1-720(+)
MGQGVPMQPGQALPMPMQPVVGQAMPMPAQAYMGQAPPMTGQGMPVQGPGYVAPGFASPGYPVQGQAAPGGYAQQAGFGGMGFGDKAKIAAGVVGVGGLAAGLGMLMSGHGNDHHHHHHSEFHHEHHHSGLEFGLGGGHQRCYKCEGRGFVHESTMNHDEDDDERCFFCTDCSGCRGTGHISGGGGFGGGMFGFGGAERCYKCHGRGFAHESSMNHDKDDDERCFFCEDCRGCGGKGHL